MKKMFFLFTCLLIISTTADAQKAKWEKLGSRKVNYALDKDVIVVGANKGGFKKLRLLVTGGNLNIRKMVVEYGNGTKDQIPLVHQFAKGSLSRVIDLERGKRIIKTITFWYDTKNRSRRRATLTIAGRR